jgi:hypothetical protein
MRCFKTTLGEGKSRHLPAQEQVVRPFDAIDPTPVKVDVSATTLTPAATTSTQQWVHHVPPVTVYPSARRSSLGSFSICAAGISRISYLFESVFNASPGKILGQTGAWGGGS